MLAFVDICPRCHKRFCWFGEPAGRPPCPKCGHSGDQAREDAKDIEDFKEALRAHERKRH
jgi:hypothetical protein